MSSDDDSRDVLGADYSEAVEGGKKRKVSRACDTCRKMRVRCDALNRPGKPCSHCVTAKVDCTFVAPAPKRYPPKGYIEDLERRCEALERLVLKLAPELDIEAEVGPKFNQDTWATLKGPIVRIPSPPLSVDVGPAKPRRQGPISMTRVALEKEDPAQFIPISDLQSRLEELSISHLEERFQRNCSDVAFIQKAMNLKNEAGGSGGVRKATEKVTVSDKIALEGLMFPPRDLADVLVDLAFRRALVLYPMVHRPTFEANRKSKHYTRDLDFAQVYLMVCAVGSQYCSDSRACVRTPGGEIEWCSRGWPFFIQVLNLRRPVAPIPNLPELQTKALMCVYLTGNCAPHAAWLLASTTLQTAEDVYREKLFEEKNPLDDQMWRRVFWSLVLIDRMTSTGSRSRPVVSADEDADSELPLQVDDEYYDEETKEWAQPPDKPSRMTAFYHYVKLFGLLMKCNRALTKMRINSKSPDPKGTIPAIVDLDSALNQWLNDLPDHITWRPDRVIEDDIFFDQAAQLRMVFHFVQIMAHRAYVPALSGVTLSDIQAISSTAVCMNASRSTIRILEAYSERGLVGTTVMHALGFIASIILLTNVWEMKKKSIKYDPMAQLDEVIRCMKWLRRESPTGLVALRFLTMLSELASVHGISIPDIPELPCEVGIRARRTYKAPMTPPYPGEMFLQPLFQQAAIIVHDKPSAAYRKSTQPPAPPPATVPGSSSRLPVAHATQTATAESNTMQSTPLDVPLLQASMDGAAAWPILQEFPMQAVPQQSWTSDIPAQPPSLMQAQNIWAPTGLEDWNWFNDVLTGLPPMAGPPPE